VILRSKEGFVMSAVSKREASRGRVSKAQSLTPDLSSALSLYHQRAAFYDMELAPFESLRRQAVAQLALRPGEKVLDLGCGTGLSLPLLAEAVGAGGEVWGIEPSHDMMGRALERQEEHGWPHVRLSESCVDTVAWPADWQADAALFMFTHDLLQQPECLQKVMDHLRDGARIVSVGLQWAPAWSWACNAWVWSAALYSATALGCLHEPWRHLAALVPDLEIRPLWMGTMFMATGHKH
jgi:SAM-dependent methyltransferase